MKKLLVVFGAAELQGRSVINFVLQDPALSKEFRIRGVTYTAGSTASIQSVWNGAVEIFQCNMEIAEEVEKAVRDAHTVFAVTLPSMSTGFEPE